jgi:hypothetical protein
MTRGPRFLASLTLALALVPAAAAHAQRVEVGSSLINITVTTDDENVTMVGIPSGGFGLLSPSVYGSFLIGERLAVEPQIGLLWMSWEGESQHMINFTGQVDYFLRSSRRSSPYLFAAAGLLESGDSSTPKTYGGGIGYRSLLGDRLAIRVDGRYTHYTSGNGGDGSGAVALTVSLGGVFGN